MDEQGLWRLFFATGSPLVWLAIRRLEQDEGQQAVPALSEQNIKTEKL